MDAPYSDPSPAIDYYMRASREGENPNDEDKPPGCVVIALIVVFAMLMFLFYWVLK